MRRGLVVVDAWSVSKSLLDLGEKMHRNEPPQWSSEVKDNVKNFSNFLDYVCDIERKKGTTIIHTFGVNNSQLFSQEKINISQLTVDEKDKVTFAIQLGATILESNIDEVYFCGFHFGLCIHDKIANVSELTDYNGKLGVIINLSMLLPVDTFKRKFERFHKPNKPRYKPNHAWDYYLWTPKCEFEKIDISFP